MKMEKILMLFCAFALAGCPVEENPSTETPVDQNAPVTETGTQPPEADNFSSLTLADAYKAFSEHNPIMTHKFGADPFGIVYNDRVYIYMTGDTLRYSGGVIQQNDYSNINIIRVLSSGDMVNWTDHGDIRVAGSSGATVWASQSWAPAFAYKEIGGVMKFFLYFANGAGGIGVLTSDNPAGPFTDPIGRALVSTSTPNTAGIVWLFDPAVFVDDDGTGYLYFGGGTPAGGDAAQGTSNHPEPGTIRGVKLGADMTSLDGNPVDFPVPFSFEDSGINKISGKYVYSYCTNPQVNNYAVNFNNANAQQLGSISMGIAYMTSDKPLADFVLGTTFFEHPGTMFNIKSGNNHHCLFQFKGKWYITYHSRLLADAMGLDADGLASANGEGYRITHVDRVNVRSNGTIAMSGGTRAGVDQVGRHDPYTKTEAETIGVMAGINTKADTAASGGMAVTEIDSGDWLALYGVDFGSVGASKFTCRVKPAAEGGIIQIRMDSLEGARVGYVTIPGTTGGDYTDFTTELLQAVTGVHDLVFIFSGGGLDCDSWQFE